jgi:hypothetical protein
MIGRCKEGWVHYGQVWGGRLNPTMSSCTPWPAAFNGRREGGSTRSLASFHYAYGVAAGGADA